MLSTVSTWRVAWETGHVGDFGNWSWWAVDIAQSIVGISSSFTNKAGSGSFTMWASILTFFTNDTWNVVSEVASGYTLVVLEEEASGTKAAVSFAWTDSTVVNAVNALKVGINVFSSGTNTFTVWGGWETWKAQVAAVVVSASETVLFAYLTESQWFNSEEVALWAGASSVVAVGGWNGTSVARGGVGALSTSWWAWLADTGIIVETFLADTFVARNL